MPRLVAFAVLSSLLGACGGSADSKCTKVELCDYPAGGGSFNGGASSSGGKSGVGGALGSGGQPGVGGALGSGGQSDVAGAPGSGGKSGVAGALGSGGKSGVAGALGSGGGAVCCEAYPSCDAGDTDIGPSASCPQGATCYPRSLCCTTIYCAHPNAQCTALPTCDPGDKEIAGECPPNGACYRRTQCGSTINCLDSACDPKTEYNKQYVATSVSKCAVIDFRCQTNTSYFQNDCGCGCAQDANCPASVDCEPGGAIDPLCTDLASCPLTPRAL